MTEPVDLAALAASAPEVPREWFEALLDAIPTPLLLLELGTARVLYANAAADEMAGGEFPRGRPAERYHEVYFCTDDQGRRIPDAEMPGVRAARGERVRDYQMDWHLPDRVRSLVVKAEPIGPLHGQPAMTIVVFDDVSDLKRAEEEARIAEHRKDESLALLDTLFSSAPVGLAFLDRELRYVRVNEALAAMNGVPAEEHLGRPVPEVLPDVDAEILAALRRVLDDGQPLVDAEIVIRTPAQPEVDRHWTVSLYPVRHRTGVLLGLGAVAVDVTERVRLLESERRARERASFLARAGEVLGSSLDWEDTLRRVARLAVPGKADWCAVDMREPTGALRRLAVAHVEPGKEALGRELFERWPPRAGDPGVPEVLRTGRPALLAELPDELLQAEAKDPEHLRILRELGLRSGMVVPLHARGAVVGAMTFVLAESGGRYGQEDLDLAMDVARRASAAIENASLHRQIGYIARTLQESLLPPRLPEVPGFEVAARYRAAGEGFEVGGDFYDVFATREGAWAVVLGDVCGKGPSAAALTALARYTARAAAIEHPEPSRALTLLNEAILREDAEDRFMTAVQGWLELRDDAATLTLAGAGHPPALLLRGDRATPLPGSNQLLGVLARLRLEDHRVELEPGDAVVLYTDGVSDAAAPRRILALEDLLAAVQACAGRSAEEIAAALERLALEGTGGRPRDDMAIVVLRRRP